MFAGLLRSGSGSTGRQTEEGDLTRWSALRNWLSPSPSSSRIREWGRNLESRWRLRRFLYSSGRHRGPLIPGTPNVLWTTQPQARQTLRFRLSSAQRCYQELYHPPGAINFLWHTGYYSGNQCQSMPINANEYVSQVLSSRVTLCYFKLFKMYYYRFIID